METPKPTRKRGSLPIAHLFIATSTLNLIHSMYKGMDTGRRQRFFFFNCLRMCLIRALQQRYSANSTMTRRTTANTSQPSTVMNRTPASNKCKARNEID
jgi:hypothetical protein